MAPKAQPKVKIYTASWCTFCRAEKKFLDQHKISYEAVDVEADEAAGRELNQLSGQFGVPFTVITKPDGATLSILGFDQSRLTTELGLQA